MAVFASEARRSLFPLIKRVNADRSPVEIVTRGGERAFLVAAEDYESMVETNYLLQSPVNADRLRGALADVRAGHNLVTPSSEELAALAAGKTEASIG
jgi:antitoxin YefM